MSENVVGIVPGIIISGAARPQPDIITTLRELLAEAESGKVQELAFAAYDNEGHTLHWCSKQNSETLIGALETTKCRIVRMRDRDTD